jgi:uncharacterized membrane protein
MANDLSDTVRDALGHVVRDAMKNMGSATPSAKSGKGGLSGMKGLAAGAGLAAAAPLAKKGVDAVRGSGGGLPTPRPAAAASKVASKAASTAGEKVGSNLKEAVTSKIDEAGGAGGLVKEAASGLLPGGGGDSGGGKGGMPGVGKGRRMPVQQSVDVAVPVETAYNQWTQFEDWPEFMHRVTRVSQEDDCTVNFATKIWGKTKEFTAKIETQRPDERIKWKVSQGITHTGVVTFHELAPRLTRIELNVDVAPGSLLEKAARGMRHIKRAMRADLHRFKAFIEMQEHETGAWRGVIEDGELVEEHDPSYDEEREYSDIEEIKDEAEQDEQEQDEDEQDEDEQDDQDEEQDDDEQEEQDEESGSAQRTRSRSAQSRRPSDSRSSRSRSRSRGATNGSSKRSGSSKKPSRSAAASRSSSSRTASSSKPKSKAKAKSSSSRSTAKSRSSKSSGSSNGKAKSSSGGRRKASNRS